MKTWTLQLPRCKCPSCGSTLRIKFCGRMRILKPRKVRGEETREEGSALPCEGDGSAEVPLQKVPEQGD